MREGEYCKPVGAVENGWAEKPGWVGSSFGTPAVNEPAEQTTPEIEHQSRMLTVSWFVERRRVKRRRSLERTQDSLERRPGRGGRRERD